MFLINDVLAIKALVYIVIVIIAFVFVILASNNIDVDAKSIGTLNDDAVADLDTINIDLSI